jgi:hypothetical protein
MDELVAMIARRERKGKSNIEGKLPLKCFFLQ